MNKIYYYCKLFVYSLLLAIVLRFNFLVAIVLDENIINITFFNYCRQKINKYRFYYLYFNHLVKQKKILKSFFINKINIIICQNYLLILKVLIFIEKILII